MMHYKRRVAMDSDQGFVRRIRAVLLADVASYSTHVGEDAEATARAIEEVVGLFDELVPGAHLLEGDSVRLSFDNVTAAVETAMELQKTIAARTFGGRRLQMRIGIHAGDVLERGGTIVGDAINIAARLAALAEPGTVCVSDTVFRQVRSRFGNLAVDLGRQRLKNIAEPVHAYLLAPAEQQIRARRRRMGARRWFAFAAVLLACLLAAATARRAWRDARSGDAGREPAPRTELLTLGVMVFRTPSASAADAAWMRDSLRDEFNTQLSQISGVKVYSKEFLDFLVSRQGLTEIEAASKLGIGKMLSGSIGTANDVLRIEAHVVDVASGVLEASYSTSGPPAEFVRLQSETIVGLTQHLGLPVEVVRRNLQEAAGEANREALSRMLAAEGAAAPPPAPAEPHSTIPAPFAHPFRLPFVATAHAQEGDPERVAIVELLERYRRAAESRQIDAVAALHVQMPAEQRAAQQRYFENVRELKVAITEIDIAVVGVEAVVSYTRTDDLVDKPTGRPLHVAARFTKVLRKVDGQWRIGEAR